MNEPAAAPIVTQEEQEGSSSAPPAPALLPGGTSIAATGSTRSSKKTLPGGGSSGGGIGGLEVGWTRINRRPRGRNDPGGKEEEGSQQAKKKKKVDAGVGGEDNNAAEENEEDDEGGWLASSACCDDPSCRRRIEELFLENLEQGGGAATTPRNVAVEGQAVFLLHEPNPDWFQGYLFRGGGGSGSGGCAGSLLGSTTNSEKKKPWGLLARQLEIDECLQCSEGGYRRIKLTVFPYEGETASSPGGAGGAKEGGNEEDKGEKKKKRSAAAAAAVRNKKTTLDRIDWTGGDMMQLQSPAVRMRADRLVTGPKAVPFVEGVFGGLLRKLRAAEAEEEVESCGDGGASSGVLELLPDCAIVIGTIQLILPVAKDDDDDLFDDMSL